MFGATSMVGSHFLDAYPGPVAAAGRNAPSRAPGPVERFDAVDLTKPREVGAYVRSTIEPVVVNFAARTDVDGVERERPRAGGDAQGPAWAVNSLAPEEIARATRESGRYFVQLSTDFVFDGRNGPYAESAFRSSLSPDLSWYGWTKSEGERRVVASDPHAAIVRISYPYRARFPPKVDFARRIVASRRAGGLSPLFSDQQITPTWIPDVSAVVRELAQRRPAGVFHVASPSPTTPLEFGTELLRRVEGRVPSLAGRPLPRPGEDPTRAPRPRLGGLGVGRVAELDLTPTGWREGVARLVAAEEWVT